VPAPGLKHVRIPRKMLLHRLDAVERSQAAGRDTSGNPIEAWIQTYPSAKYPKLLRGFVNELHPHEVLLYQQAGIEAQYEIYIDRFDDGTVPDIGIRDRIRWGMWPNGSPRYLRVTSAYNPLGENVLLEVTASARKPG
jgi:hypothetical protein